MARGSRRRGGWRRKGKKLQVYVRLHAAAGGMRTRMYDLGTAPSEMQDWIDDQVTTYRRLHPKGDPGTLAHDVPTYLKLLVDRPKLQRDRRLQLAWWCKTFGKRARWSLQPVDLEIALKNLLASGVAPSTVRKYRTALFHLFTKLDGKNAPNPLRDVPPPADRDALPRALPYPIIRQILDHIPDRRYARALTSGQIVTIRAQARRRGANYSAIAQAFGVSEARVRKIRSSRDDGLGDVRSISKIVLRAMAFTPLPPAQLRRIAGRPEDVDAATSSVVAHARRKGKGTRSKRIPVPPDGLAALQDFVAVVPATFSMGSVERMWKRGIDRLCRSLEADAATAHAGAQLRQTLADATPYDLRHSFLTVVQVLTGNRSATQGMGMHADPRTSERYTLAAVDPTLEHAAALLTAHWAGQRIGNETPHALSSKGKIWPKTARRKSQAIATLSHGKARKYAGK